MCSGSGGERVTFGKTNPALFATISEISVVSLVTALTIVIHACGERACFLTSTNKSGTHDSGVAGEHRVEEETGDTGQGPHLLPS